MAGFLDEPSGVVSVAVLVEVGDEHVSAFADESDRHRPADTAVAAGDDRGLSRPFQMSGAEWSPTPGWWPPLSTVPEGTSDGTAYPWPSFQRLRRPYSVRLFGTDSPSGGGARFAEGEVGPIRLDISKWFLSNDSLYRREPRRVWLWEEWPGRRGVDSGVDLVGEDIRGQLWAVQAKAYDPAYSVTKAEVGLLGEERETQLRGGRFSLPRRSDGSDTVRSGDGRTRSAFKTVRFAIPNFIPKSAANSRLLGLSRADIQSRSHWQKPTQPSIGQHSKRVPTLFETVRFGHSRIPPSGSELVVYISQRPGPRGSMTHAWLLLQFASRSQSYPRSAGTAVPCLVASGRPRARQAAFVDA